MAGEWETVPLETLVEPDRSISYGIVQPGGSVPNGVPIVRVTDVRNGRISTADPLKVAPQIEASYARTRLRGGELLLTLVGTVGETAVAPESLGGWNVARAVAVIPVRREIGAYWVQVALKAPTVRHIIDSRLNTTVQATLNLRDVAQLPIVLPLQRERERIAHVLRTLDDKIELNRRMNETLEAMARAIFKSWFVDFDPVRAKAEGRQPSGMDPEATALFPDSFDDSSLGQIPKGWKAGKASDLGSVVRDTLNPGDYPDEVFDHYSIPAFDEGRLPKPETGQQIKSNKFVVSGEAVLLSKLNPRFPRVWLPAISHARRSICSTEFLVALPQSDVTCEYLYGLFSSTSFLDVFATLVTGTSGSHQRVKPGFLIEMDVVIPDEALRLRFAALVKPLLQRIAKNLSESLTLAAIRDALLPKLLSGEIRVKDAEKTIGMMK